MFDSCFTYENKHKTRAFLLTRETSAGEQTRTGEVDRKEKRLQQTAASSQDLLFDRRCVCVDLEVAQTETVKHKMCQLPKKYLHPCMRQHKKPLFSHICRSHDVHRVMQHGAVGLDRRGDSDRQLRVKTSITCAKHVLFCH